MSRHDAALAQTDQLLPRSTPADVIYLSIPPNAHQRSNGDRPFTVGFIGRLVEQKNPFLFLEVMKQLPGVRGVFGGGGPFFDELKRRCIRDGLAPRLEMTGDLEHADVLQLLCSIDALVMTSLWEGLPLLLLEAMHTGVPVVSVPVGGVPEIIEHGRTGLLSRGYDAGELAELVRRLRNDPLERASIAAAAQSEVKEKFLESQMIASIGNLYREVLGVGPTA